MGHHSSRVAAKPLARPVFGRWGGTRWKRNGRRAGERTLVATQVLESANEDIDWLIAIGMYLTHLVLLFHDGR